jgi:hypothetical protein
MMDNILDDTPYKNETILFSKASIIITSILFSPIYGGYLYCSNLKFVGQKNKINRTFITIVLCYLSILLPLMGFEYPSISFYPYKSFFIAVYFSHFISSIFMTIILWNKQLQKISYTTIFPWYRFISIVIIEFALIVYRTWIYSENYTQLNFPLPRHYIDFSLLSLFSFIFYFSLGDFVIRLISKRKKKS